MTPGEWIGFGVLLLMVGGTLWRLASKVAALDANVTRLLDAVKLDRQEHQEIWDRLTKHGERLAGLEAKE